MLNDKTRRLLLQSAMTVPIWTSAGLSEAAKPLQSSWQATLSILLDNLIPADETPSATQLGVHSKLIHFGSSIPNYVLMLTEGAAWLDSQATRFDGANSFEKLSLKQQSTIIDLGFSSPANTLPRVFLSRVLEDAFRFYYQHPKSWSKIIAQPLQPLGYPDFNKVPKSL